MKKLFYIAVMAGLLAACSKERTAPEYPSLAGTFSQESYFLPAWINDEDAPPLALNQPIILQYYSKLPYAADFLVKEGNVLLARISPQVDHITAPGNGYYQVGFPLEFRVPELWAGKLITIIPNDGTNAFTKFRVMKPERVEIIDY